MWRRIRPGGPPGRYAVFSIFMFLVWFPIRLLVLDRDEPFAEVVAAAGLSGAIWGIMPVVMDSAQRNSVRAKVRARAPGAAYPQAPAEHRAWARRGILVGLVAGVPFYAALLVFCLVTGRAWQYAASFGVVLAAMAAAGAWSLRRAAGESSGAERVLRDHE